ncbi:MAG: hypothetical protein D6722_19755 [Bacteroidetes bacterium]|nr:MAG: hypothetical protein D6722_19755 [Bacteroidota bacterium]
MADDPLHMAQRLARQYLVATPQEEAFLAEVADQRAVFLQQVTALVNWLLREDYARLINTLYRIDVREQDFLSAMQQAQPAEAVAEAILNRLIEKAETRIRYRGWRGHNA